MEKAVLKTLVYANLFDFPLTIFEIHKWLIGEKVKLRQVEEALRRLSQESRVKSQGRYYFLPKKNYLASRRIRNKKYVHKYLNRAKMAANILRIIPWIKLVGISGGLAMENVSKKDDIDLFIITEKNRIWVSRLLSIFILSIFRRKVADSKKEVSGKICLNLFLDTENLIQRSKDIYTAHEILQMKVCWERNGVYHKFLSVNAWVFKFLPNWVTGQSQKSKVPPTGEAGKSQKYDSRIKIFDKIEKIAKQLQLKIMNKQQGMERVDNGALYFHPQNYRARVLSEYNRQLKATLDKKLAVE